MSSNLASGKLAAVLTVAVVTLLSTGALCAQTQKPKLAMLSMISTADANVSMGEVSAVTDDDYFARVQISPGTRITQDGKDFGLPQIRGGLKLSCKGNWDSSAPNVFRADYVFVGAAVSDSEVAGRVAAACQKVSVSGTAQRGSESATCTRPGGLPANDSRSAVRTYLDTIVREGSSFVDCNKKLLAECKRVSDDGSLPDANWVEHSFGPAFLEAQRQALRLAGVAPVPPEFSEWKDTLDKWEAAYEEFLDSLRDWVMSGGNKPLLSAALDQGIRAQKMLNRVLTAATKVPLR